MLGNPIKNMNIQSLKILSLLVIVTFAPMTAFGGCSWDNCSGGFSGGDEDGSCDKKDGEKIELLTFPMARKCCLRTGASNTGCPHRWKKKVTLCDGGTTPTGGNYTTTGASGCWNWSCNSGFEKSGRTCVKTCSAGQFASGGSCSTCVAGTYSTGGTATSCTSCGSGKTSPAGSTSSSACVATTTSSSSTTTATVTATPTVTAAPSTPAVTTLKIPASAFTDCGAVSSSQVDFESCVFAKGRSETSGGTPTFTATAVQGIPSFTLSAPVAEAVTLTSPIKGMGLVQTN